MKRNGVPHPAKTLLLFAAMAAALLLSARASAGTPAIPFGAQAQTYAAHIRPTAGTAAVQTATANFYNNWKTAYLQQKCGTTPSAHYRILYNASDQTVSEAHGYGMLITVLMAGHDPNAKAIFDGMVHYYRAHPATAPAANRLLAWKQDGACANIEGASSASDGDLDVALALLMADRQWGSCSGIDYRSDANLMIAQIKQYDLNSSAKYVKLGNWATTGNYLNSTRSSDFMPGHYRSFQWSTGDAAWNGLIDHTYYLVTATAHATTGLLPDFIANPLGVPTAAPANFLESADDGAYNWNACRDPWRLGTDYLVSGDARAKAALQKIVTWAKGAPINGNAANVRAGYQLNGTALVAYGDRGFTVPLAVGAMVDASNQALLDAFWGNAQVSGTNTVGYYGDSIKLLSMIVLSGNWWQPESMPDPCAVGTATSTPTRTATRTATPSATPSRTATLTTTPTATPTATASRTGSASPTSTFSGTLTASSTRTATPSATPTATRTASPSATGSASPTSTFSGTLTASSTRTATLSATPTASATVSATATPSLTEAPLGSTATVTPTATPSRTDTPTSTPSASSTLTATLTGTLTGTPIASASSTAVSTASATPTRTSTPSATQTGTPVASASSTAAATSTVTPSASATVTTTVTLTIALPATATASPTAQSSPLATAIADGALVIEQAVPFPQPNPRVLAVYLQGRAERLRLRCYTTAWVLTHEQSYPGGGPGWVHLSLPVSLSELPNGLSYFSVQASRQGAESRPKSGPLLRLR